MDIKAKDVKKFRDITGVGIMDAKGALKEAKGDLKKAKEIIKKKGLDKIAKKSDRDASEGVIESYIHGNGKIGVLVQVSCETDFVARNDEFKSMSHEIAMQIAASDPKYIRPDDVPKKVLDGEKKVLLEQLKKEGKPQGVLDKIIAGKLKKYAAEISLIRQPLVRDPKKTVEDLIAEQTTKLGEKMEIIRFIRYSL